MKEQFIIRLSSQRFKGNKQLTTLRNRIFAIVLLGILTCAGQTVYAQLEVEQGDVLPNTPENIVENVFLGNGVEVLDIEYFGDPRAVGVFKNGMSSIGLENGIMLSTGLVENASLPNDSGSYSGDTTSFESVFDLDLRTITPEGNQELIDIAKYEIEFIPESDTIQFRYVFASEEYPEFVCSDFNDVFGFFISGPNPSGGNYNAKNLALVPDPANDQGNTFLNYNVAINSVNNGTIGITGVDESYCMDPLGSFNFSQYYNETPFGVTPVYDGYLDVFIAQAVVIPCQEYKIKLAISDVADHDYDSAVFLEAKSFFSTSLELNLNTASVDGAIAEGCSSAEIEINIPQPLATDFDIQIQSVPFGTFPDQAQSGVDYNPIPSNLTIPAGSTSLVLTLDAIEDNIVEGDEFIYLDIARSVCARDTLAVRIRDRILSQVMLPEDTIFCTNLIELIPTFNPPIQSQPPQVFRNMNRLELTSTSEVYTSIIGVSNVIPDELQNGVLNQVCIDTLVGRNLDDFDLFLKGPQGQILELSTDNGFEMEPANCDDGTFDPICIDTFINTCFDFVSTQNINNGNDVLGPIFPGNPTYTGRFLPEGDWNDFITGNSRTNGSWELSIRVDEEPLADDLANGVNYFTGWSITFNSPYEVNHFWSPNQDITCTECDTAYVIPTEDITYTVNSVDSYGCETSDEIFIDVLPILDAPTVTGCTAISPSSILISWESSGPDAVFYNVRNRDVPPWFQWGQTNFVFPGLEADKEHCFWISVFNGECASRITEVCCTTPPCSTVPPTISDVQVSAPSCVGRNDGVMEIFAEAENGGSLTYYLNGTLNFDGVFTDLRPGEYLVRVVDSEGCPTVQTVVIPDSEPLEYTEDISPVTCEGFSDASVEIIVTDDAHPPYEIIWNHNASTEFFQDGLATGVYEFGITDTTGCVFFESILIDDPDLLNFENIITEAPPCFGGEGTIVLEVGGGTLDYQYEWSDTTEDISSVSFLPGEYSVTVTDNNGCTIVAEAIIPEREEIMIISDTIQAACIDETSQLFSVDITGGVGPYEVEWDDNFMGQEIENLPTGTYQITVLDSNNCEQFGEVVIENYPDLILEIDTNEPECSNVADGIISVTSAVYSDSTDISTLGFIWSNGETGVAIGELFGDSTYQLTVTDDFGCEHEEEAYLGGPDPIVGETEVLHELSCYGDSTGSFMLEVSGGTGILDVQWPSDIDVNGNVAENLAAGIYPVLVMDELDCVTEFEVEFEQPDSLFFMADITGINCFSDQDGSIIGQVFGGTGITELEWSNGEKTESITNLEAGEYSLTLTDENGCQFFETYEIGTPMAEFIVDVVGIDVQCFMTNSGSIEVYASGGTEPYQIFVDSVNYFNTELIDNLAAGTYEMYAIDGNGCEVEIETVNIEEALEKFIDLGESDIGVEIGSDYEPSIITNATDLVEYSWITTPPNVALSCDDCPNPMALDVENSFTLELTARDSNGCKFSDSQFIFITDGSFVVVPTAFSPNGNGVNERLVVYGKSEVVIKRFEIFDRWGELVYVAENFETNETFIGWDGTFNGKELNSGVYVWKALVIKKNGEEQIFEGSSTLLK